MSNLTNRNNVISLSEHARRGEDESTASEVDFEIEKSKEHQDRLDFLSNKLERLRELAVQASDESKLDVDRAALNDEAQALVKEIERVSQELGLSGADEIK